MDLMETATLLRRTVAEFFEVDEGQVGPSFSLQARQGSIARAALDAAIRGRVGLKSQAVYSAKTFGELEAEIAPGSSSPSPDSSPAPVAVPAAPAPVPGVGTSGASCGVDLELIAGLPVADDAWEHDFYRAHFTPSEIAYCLRQPEPLTHFAARWCAKEALKKSDRAFLAVDPKQIEVVLDEAGAPHLEYSDGSGPSRRLPHAVSLSHTSHAAIAVVVRVDPPPPSSPMAAVPVIAPPTPAEAPVRLAEPARRRGSLLLVALNLLAIGLALLALARTIPSFRWLFPGS
jgi:phosphopantetheine--protein transferase-like protein